MISANSIYGYLWNVLKSLWNPLNVHNPFSCLKDSVIKRKEASFSFSVVTTATGSEKNALSPHGWSHDNNRNSCFSTEMYCVGVPKVGFSTSGQCSNNGISSIHKEPKDFLKVGLQELAWTWGSREWCTFSPLFSPTNSQTVERIYM